MILQQYHLAVLGFYGWNLVCICTCVQLGSDVTLRRYHGLQAQVVDLPEHGVGNLIVNIDTLLPITTWLMIKQLLWGRIHLHRPSDPTNNCTSVWFQHTLLSVLTSGDSFLLSHRLNACSDHLNPSVSLNSPPAFPEPKIRQPVTRVIYRRNILWMNEGRIAILYRLLEPPRIS